VISPFSLRLTSPRRLLLLSLADDPVYKDLEVQWVHDDERDVSGMVLLAIRLADSRTDVLVDNRLDLPREDYEVAGGISAFEQVRMEPARFQVDSGGVDLELGTTLADGRTLRMRIRERLTRRRWAVNMLAPAGASMQHPRFFPFFWMGEIGFLRWRGATVEVLVDGQQRRVVRLGVPWRLTRYATAPMTALWNESADGPVEIDGQPSLSTLSVTRGGHELSIEHVPPVPDVADLLPGDIRSGRARARVDGRTQIAGSWTVRRFEEAADISIEVDQPWDPGPQPAIARAVFALLKVFRTWPTTYRWQAHIDLRPSPPTIRSGWLRRP
jgi:hypothetical protein